MLLSYALAVFPCYSIEQLLNDVGECVLYQAETIKANQMGYDRTQWGKQGTDSDFKARWEMTTGRVWNPSQS